MPVREVLRNTSVGPAFPVNNWDVLNAPRLHLRLIQEADDSFSAIVLNLPGSGSAGDTVEEAIENAKEAVRGVLESYEADGIEAPWKDSTMEPIPFGAEHRWVVLDG